MPVKPKLKILCVDDDEIITAYVEALLGKRYDVRTANSAAEGLGILAGQDVDWVMVDYQMPDMNGALFMMSARQTGKRPSFILLTGLGVGQLDWEGLAPLGLRGSLKKPLDPDLLLDIIEGAGWKERENPGFLSNSGT